MRRSPVVVVFLTVFVDLLGFGMIVPLLARYGERYGATPFQSGLLVATYSIAQFVFAPLWGAWSDRVGRRPVLRVTLLGNVAAYALFALADGLGGLFLSRALAGAFAANIATAQAYVADVTTKEDRAKGMGMIGMAFGLGFVLGPAIGGLLAASVGVWAPGAAAAVLSATAFGIAMTRLPESLPPELRGKARGARHPILDLKTALSRREVARLLAFYFFLVFGFANLESMLSLFLHDRFGWDEAASGLVFVYIGLVLAVAQGVLLGRLSRRYGEPRILRWAPLLLVVGMQGYWLGPNVAWFLASVPAVALGFGLSNPSVASLISKRTPADMQGRTLGLSQSLGALARASSPGLAGWLYGHFPRTGGSVAPFVWGGAVVLLGLGLGWAGLSPVSGDDGPPAADGAPERVR